jgi:hypothetical protein
MTLKQADTGSVLVFLVLAFLHLTFFRVIPFPLGLLTLLVALLAGLTAFVLCAGRVMERRQWSSAIGLSVLAAACAGWYVLPTDDYSIYVKFKLEQPQYEAAIRGERCTLPNGCLSSAGLPGFLVFPYDGLSVWVGIVYAPEGRIDRLMAQPQAFSGDVSCSPKPIEGHFFVCGFY